MSAEDTDEAEAEAEAGDRAGTVQGQGLGLVLAPHLDRYHVLPNALLNTLPNAHEDGLPRIQGLPGKHQMQAFTCVSNMVAFFASLTYLIVFYLQAKKQVKALS